MQILNLFNKRNQGLTKEEVDYVIDTFEQDSANPDSLFYLILLIGRFGSEKHILLLEKFLDYHSDPMIVWASIEVLCIQWRLSKNYLEYLAHGIKGFTWDWGQDVKRICFSALGHYLADFKNPSLLKLLIDIFNQNIDGCKVDAYIALEYALKWEKKLDITEIIDENIESQIDWELIASCKNRLQKELISL